MTSAVILAGGKSTRMGKDKLSLTAGGTTLLNSAVERFSKHFDNVCISVDSAGKYPDIKVLHVVDIFPGCGPISGLHAALTTVPGGGVFLTAADMPFSNPETALRLIDLCGDYDACVIKHDSGSIEPLFAYYTKALLPACTAAIERKKYRVAEVLASCNTRYVPTSELGIQSDEIMLMNVNTPDDYTKAAALMEK